MSSSHLQPTVTSASHPVHRIPFYKILGRIATGGMGAVYLGVHGEDADFERPVAIKIIHEHLAENRVFVDMLLDEARLASNIDHGNVVGIIDFGEFEGRHFVVMPYIEGGTLSELIRKHRKQMPIALANRVIFDALNGLQAAHAMVDDAGQPLSLVHRDVSPGNILIGTDGIARVIDFGVAKAASRITHTAPGTVKGKFSYMAPEQAKGLELDHRADIFSAGVVLWTALTGSRLFTGSNNAQTIHNLISADVPPPSAKRPQIPPSFDEICLRALERNPDKRYQSAAEMAEAISTAAIAVGEFGSAQEVGQWIADTFSERIARRHTVIEQLNAETTVINDAEQSFQLDVGDLDRELLEPHTPITPSGRHSEMNSGILQDIDHELKLGHMSTVTAYPDAGSDAQSPVSGASRSYSWSQSQSRSQPISQPQPIAGPNASLQPQETHQERKSRAGYWTIFGALGAAVVVLGPLGFYLHGQGAASDSPHEAPVVQSPTTDSDHPRSAEKAMHAGATESANRGLTSAPETQHEHPVIINEPIVIPVRRITPAANRTTSTTPAAGNHHRIGYSKAVSATDKASAAPSAATKAAAKSIPKSAVKSTLKSAAAKSTAKSTAKPTGKPTTKSTAKSAANETATAAGRRDTDSAAIAPRAGANADRHTPRAPTTETGTKKATPSGDKGPQQRDLAAEKRRPKRPTKAKPRPKDREPSKSPASPSKRPPVMDVEIEKNPYLDE